MEELKIFILGVIAVAVAVFAVGTVKEVIGGWKATRKVERPFPWPKWRSLEEGTVGEISEELADELNSANESEAALREIMTEQQTNNVNFRTQVRMKRRVAWEKIGDALGIHPFEARVSYTQHMGKHLIIKGLHSDYPELAHKEKEEVKEDGKK